MNRETEAGLLAFCAGQHARFQHASWMNDDRPHGISRTELACAALFLAGVDWYGHERQLEAVAEQLIPGARTRFPGVAMEVGFDFARFSNMLRRELEYAGTTS